MLPFTHPSLRKREMRYLSRDTPTQPQCFIPFYHHIQQLALATDLHHINPSRHTLRIIQSLTTPHQFTSITIVTSPFFLMENPLLGSTIYVQTRIGAMLCFCYVKSRSFKFHIHANCGRVIHVLLHILSNLPNPFIDALTNAC